MSSLHRHRVPFASAAVVTIAFALAACGDDSAAPAGDSTTADTIAEPSSTIDTTAPASNPTTVETDSADTTNTPPSSDAPFDLEPVDTSSLESLVGTATLAEFEAAAAELPATVRQVTIDGEPQMITMDYRSNRINVETETRGGEAIVTAIVNVG